MCASITGLPKQVVDFERTIEPAKRCLAPYPVAQTRADTDVPSSGVLADRKIERPASPRSYEPSAPFVGPLPTLADPLFK